MKSILSLSIIFLFMLNGLSILPVYAVSNPSIVQIGQNNGIYVNSLIVTMPSYFKPNNQVYIGISLVALRIEYDSVKVSFISSSNESMASFTGLRQDLTVCGGHEGHSGQECFTYIAVSEFRFSPEGIKGSNYSPHSNQIEFNFTNLINPANASAFVFETSGYDIRNGYGASGGQSPVTIGSILVGSKNASVNDNPFHITGSNDFVFGVVAMAFSTNGIWTSPEPYYTILDNSNTGVAKYSTILPGTSPAGYYTNVALDSNMGDGWAESAIFVGPGYLS
ncbi:MAG: hypothetical protein E6L03_09915 [Thaumarchaeota archaeon]|nr:MAG: hypothetical protein E6L03_09915 [Nitrososphaerota archaeon]